MVTMFPLGLPIPLIERGPGCVTRRSIAMLEVQSSIPGAGNNNVAYLSLNQIGLL